jgi:hypothetical protein
LPRLRFSRGGAILYRHAFRFPALSLGRKAFPPCWVLWVVATRGWPLSPRCSARFGKPLDTYAASLSNFMGSDNGRIIGRRLVDAALKSATSASGRPGMGASPSWHHSRNRAPHCGVSHSQPYGRGRPGGHIVGEGGSTWTEKRSCGTSRARERVAQVERHLKVQQQIVDVLQRDGCNALTPENCCNNIRSCKRATSLTATGWKGTCPKPRCDKAGTRRIWERTAGTSVPLRPDHSHAPRPRP